MKLNLLAIAALLFTINLVTVNGYVNCNSLSDSVQKCICQVRQYTQVKLKGCQSNNTTLKKKNDEILRMAKTTVEEICKAQVKSKDRNGKDCIKAFDKLQHHCDIGVSCAKSCTDAISIYMRGHYSNYEKQEFCIETTPEYDKKVVYAATINGFYVNTYGYATVELCNNWRKQSF